jgi:group I intron endonuclease
MIVYLLTNKVNSKVYVGQHRGYSLSRRWNQRLDNVKVNNHFTNAVQKYGPESFSRKVLCHASCQQELDLLEQFFIATYKSTDPRFGYNQQSGGRVWRGQYTKRLRQLIGEGSKRVWARRSKKERWELAFAVKLQWLMRTERERQQIIAKQRTRIPWNKGMKGQGAGKPSKRKGRKFGKQRNPCRTRKPFTKEHCQRIKEALRRYHKQRRRQEKG